MSRGLLAILTILIALCARDTAHAQTTWHVDDDCTPPGAGTKDLPFCTIQDGVDASLDGDTVLVHSGMYTGTGNRDIWLFGKRITVRSVSGPNATTIDSEGSPGAIHRGFFLVHGESHETTIAGFTITGGYLIGVTDGVGQGGGGAGIYIRDSSPTIRNCIIRENISATLNPPFPVDGRGAGIYVDGSSRAILENCIIIDNLADRRGGGLYIGFQNSDVAIRNCLISGNSSGGAGNFPGGGVHNTFGGVTIIDTTIVGNSSPTSGGGGLKNEGGEAFLSNCILWGNEAVAGQQIWIQGPVLTIEYSDVEGGLVGVFGSSNPVIIWGPGMLDADPLLVDPEIDDFRLLPGSPCVDAGNNWAASSGLITDLGGLARFADDPATTDTGVAAWGVGVVDMGAYEFGGDDCNGNGTPDVQDIANRDSADCTGNNIPDECEPDCNGSGQADSCDIADGASMDCDHDNRPDECQIEIDSVPGGPFHCEPTLQTCDPDCNANGIPDACDIASGISQDCGVDGIPDDCPANPGPSITAQPANQDSEPGDLVFFAVGADGLQLEYQWRKDGENLEDDGRIIGSQTAGLIILIVEPADAGAYDCEVTDFADDCARSNPAILSVATNCPADFDDDGAVGAFDLAILLGAWGPNPDHPADLNDDDIIDAFDLALLLGAWGPCQ